MEQQKTKLGGSFRLMVPGQLNPNPLEVAILEEFARQDPGLTVPPASLRVRSREFTGVGCFTNFDKASADVPGARERQIGFDSAIRVPGVTSGLGAVLSCLENQPLCLELYTYGDELWGGLYDGFSIERTA